MSGSTPDTQEATVPMQTAKNGTVTVPAGTYFIGDPGYSVGDDWMTLLESCNYFMEAPHGKPVGTRADGSEVVAFGTATGDGCYADGEGNRYYVDAGMIGLVPVTPEGEAKLAAPPYDGSTAFGRQVTFDEPVECHAKRGVLTFGTVVIDTNRRVRA